MVHGKTGQEFKHSKNLGQRIIKGIQDKREAKFSSLGDWKLSSSTERNRRVEEGNGLPSISLRYDTFETMAGPIEPKSPYIGSYNYKMGKQKENILLNNFQRNQHFFFFYCGREIGKKGLYLSL